MSLRSSARSSARSNANCSAPRVLAAALIVVAAAGCSSGSTQPQVAALPTGAAAGSTAAAVDPSSAAPGASTAAGTAASSRPRERLDETSSQLEVLYAPWNQCMTAHGAGRKGEGATSAVRAAAQAACVHLDPLPPWQYDPANPKAMGFVQQVVACLHQHGVEYAQVVNQPGQGRIEIALGGPQNDEASIGAGLNLIPACDQQVLRENVSSTSP